MKQTTVISSALLNSALAFLASAPDNRATLPVLGMVHMKFSDGRATLTTTNLEIENSQTIPVETAPEDGTCLLLPFQKLRQIMQMQTESVSLSQDDTGKCTLRPTAGRSRYTLSGLNPDDFPKIDVSNDSAPTSVTVDAAKFGSMLRAVSSKAATNDVRYYLNSVHFKIADNKLTITATDGHRLALTTNDAQATDSLEAIVPKKTAAILIQLADDCDGPMTLSVTNNHIKVTMGDKQFTSILVDARYPDVNRVIPKNNDVKITTNKEQLSKAIQRSMILSNEKFKGGRFLFTSNGLKLTASNPAQEESEEHIELDSHNLSDDIEIGFNLNYVKDALDSLDSDVATIIIKDAVSSAIIHGKNPDEHIEVCMPMRL